MKDATPETVYLKDYTPPAWLVDKVELTFRLAPQATRVISRIAFRPNPATADRAFALDGENVKLLWARIDGAPVKPVVTETGLSCAVPDAPFQWEAEVEIAPAANTALEGLYMSRGMYCTQCEAQGFRKITYYPDRPDVMAPFSVRIESDLPVLLSNGNRREAGPGFAEWHDPWPKPSYLFALVAGELVAHPGSFRTRSGREVELNIWVRPGDEDKCAFGMEALKRSMAWDEKVFGCEYDLDIFNIVAVDDFNMGAMENKGLNIFNSAAVLANPGTATDQSFERIEAIIAHEYFHNWTGNRITCRDWFQLCLKEGLTVYRDQQFTGDMRSHAVKRIDDVTTLRARQFREDAGPLAHPVRPESFVEINNFYTATVYEKGAEIIGMLRLLVGEEAWRRGMDLYFDRHDGQAVTIEDWLAVFAEVSGRDLSQFRRWYSDAGTPHLHVAEDWADGTYSLTLRQQTAPTPGQPEKAPRVIPVAVGLLGPNGDEVQPTTVLELTETEQTFRFEGLGARPVMSLLRNFSAPVIVERAQTPGELAFLLAHDTDPFARWEAGRMLARGVIRAMLEGAAPDPAFLSGLGAVLRDDTLDPAFRARVLALPSEDDTAQALFTAGTTPDPDAIHAAHEGLREAMARHLAADLARIHAAMAVPGPYRPEAEDAGKRALGNAALALITRTDGGKAARAAFAAADNLTQQSAALASLLSIGAGEAELTALHDQWQHERLVMDRWFGLQVSCAAPDRAVATARRLTEHPLFDWKNPNRFRAVMGALAGHPAGFHARDGAGYALLADWLIRLDPVNPQTAARMTTAFETWRRYDAGRQALMRAALERIAAAPGLSRDTAEIVARMLG
ncbi:MAG: aminopeptidase N [Limimaricola sp.]|uniref:aminopeptidase N n=1 Tax=Limimaricola sp. TaxID=2211665 RepID=UPI001DCFC5F1|nr:aminopeptidase N [Limimaricola sp.]MBI1418545.1 aminopeptidase N [Limimaricola sp.]